MSDLKEVFETAKELTKDVVVDLDKPLEEEEPNAAEDTVTTLKKREKKRVNRSRV